LAGGEVIQSGSYFGKDAADFLNGINIAVAAGLLAPQSSASAYVALVGGEPLGGVGEQSASPQNTGRLPFNNCDEFVRWLADGAAIATQWMASGQHRSKYIAARIWGSDLGEIAFFGYERHIHNGFEGFKSELVDAGAGSAQDRQGAGVYGHILFSAGTLLIQKSGDPGGWFAHQGNRVKDWAQALFGSSQYESERAGNIAGRAAGSHLWNFLSGKANGKQLTSNLKRQLCDGGS
jgi:hypothetical protein